ncbi:unnamed protein product [Alopecurus aequalis]
MDVSGAQQWWEMWQLRVLVLGSLFVQSILCLLSTQRKHAIPSWLRSIKSLMYTGGDALAIYAFATLFNRQKQQTTTDGGSRTLELMWAPILLIHLGGQASINAYNLEDTKQWKHHVLVLVSKVTVALYIFFKWWPSGSSLSLAAVLLLILGILKFMEKPWALWIGSYDRLVSSIAESPPSRKLSELSLEEYVRRTNQYMREELVGVHCYQEIQNLRNFALNMLADLPISYSDRLKDVQSILKFGGRLAYVMLDICHAESFQRLYTRRFSGITDFFSFFAPLVGSASVMSFIMSKKGGYNVNDIWVTYILLCCCTILETVAIFSALILDSTSWHHMVPQYRLMSFCTLRKKPTILMKLATFKSIQKYLHEHWYTGQVPVAVEITELVFRQVRDGWSMYIHDIASYRVFNNCRCQWTLRRLVSESDHRQQLGHIATDLCFHQRNASPQGRQDEATQCSREISNYMFYLLSIRPEMLMLGTRPDLSTFASDDVFHILKDSNAPIDNEEMLARQVIDKMKPTDTPRETGTLIPDACRLAETLMDLGDEKKRWQVIQGVWVEMLCYSAARCSGYQHAKSLGDGGEYLSYVWLLWAFMGMETLAEKIHRPEPPGEKEITAPGTLASPSQGGVDQTVEIVPALFEIRRNASLP